MGDSSIKDLQAAFDLSDMYGKMGLYHTELASGLCWGKLHVFDG